jgi:hypothetical protein
VVPEHHTADKVPARAKHPYLDHACAEFERTMIRERQLEGIALVKQAGKY